MKCWIEIYRDRGIIYKEQFWLWDVEKRSWELNAKSRERQLNLMIGRLVKAIPFYDPDHTKIYVTFKSKMNHVELPDLQEVPQWEGVPENK